MTSAYDRILIGPTQVPRPHWRRGHFRRIRFGEQLSESRLGWIRPVLVKASDRPSGRQIRQSGGTAFGWRRGDPFRPRCEHQQVERGNADIDAERHAAY